MTEENRETLKESDIEILTILYGEGEECDDFEPFGPVIHSLMTRLNETTSWETAR